MGRVNSLCTSVEPDCWWQCHRLHNV